MQRMHPHHLRKVQQLRLSNHREEQVRCHLEVVVVVDRLEGEAGEHYQVVAERIPK